MRRHVEKATGFAIGMAAFISWGCAVSWALGYDLDPVLVGMGAGMLLLHVAESVGRWIGRRALANAPAGDEPYCWACHYAGDCGEHDQGEAP